MSIATPWLDATLSYDRGSAFSFVPDLGEARRLLGALSLLVVLLLTGLKPARVA